MIGWGLIGASTIARQFMIRAITSQPDSEVVAIASRDPARGRAFAAEHGIPSVYDSVEALLADGADNDEISQALVISPQTARTHVRNLLGKLAFHSRLEAASFVIRNDLRDELPAPALAGGRARIPFRSVGGWGP